MRRAVRRASRWRPHTAPPRVRGGWKGRGSCEPSHPLIGPRASAAIQLEAAASSHYWARRPPAEIWNGWRIAGGWWAGVGRDGAGARASWLGGRGRAGAPGERWAPAVREEPLSATDRVGSAGGVGTLRGLLRRRPSGPGWRGWRLWLGEAPTHSPDVESGGTQDTSPPRQVWPQLPRDWRDLGRAGIPPLAVWVPTPAPPPRFCARVCMCRVDAYFLFASQRMSPHCPLSRKKMNASPR